MKSCFSLLILILVCALATPLARAQAPKSESQRRNVEVEWEPIAGAISYEVKIIRKEDKEKKPTLIKVSAPVWRANIRPGDYEMQVRSYDDRGVAGSWSTASTLSVKLPAVVALHPSPNQIIKSKDETSLSVKFRWQEVLGASAYRIKAQTASGSWSSEKEVRLSNWEISLPAGEEIRWEVIAIDDRNDEGEKWEAPISFELRGPALRQPTIAKPMTPYLRDIRWAQPSYAKNYEYDLQFQNPKTKKWEFVESKKDFTANILPLNASRPTGKYRLQVQAFGDHREPSKISREDFNVMGNFRDPAALDTAILRESITKPTNFYAIASYLITQVTYEAQNLDANAKPTFSALGGTGRLGLGYQPPQAKWGTFGIADLSGFTINGQNFKFATFEAHLTRKLEFGQNGLLLIATGLFSKELPIVLGSSVDGFEGVGKVRGMGPHVGFTYWMPWSDRFGLQVNARAYYTLVGSSTTGGAAESTLSYQYGLLGSYRLDTKWMGYAGYAYRADKASYATSSDDPQSFATPGQLNQITLDGHYLNLILEFSF